MAVHCGRREFIALLGGRASAEFGKFIADQTDKWAKVIQFAGIKPE